MDAAKSAHPVRRSLRREASGVAAVLLVATLFHWLFPSVTFTGLGAWVWSLKWYLLSAIVICFVKRKWEAEAIRMGCLDDVPRWSVLSISLLLLEIVYIAFLAWLAVTVFQWIFPTVSSFGAFVGVVWAYKWYIVGAAVLIFFTGMGRPGSMD